MEDDITAALEAIRVEMRKIFASEEEPYAAGRNIWGIAISHTAVSPDVLYPLWLTWGALTDWVENKPDEKTLAEEVMRRAASEWLSLDAKDSKTRTAYLDRWVYDEMGHVRREE